MTHGFRPISTTALPEYRSEGHLFRHEATGCEVYHVHNDDPENLFAFIFKTPPADSTGVAHIVEHTVLCGSERYPLKDPFLVLMRGSMNTFLNAMTFPDKTVYPASSPVETDLFNIMKVYGDAVFFPLLKPEMFSQEGHRVQFDEEGNLERTGIVYNEMKGNYSSHDSIAGEWSMRSLLPDTPYGYDSGGDPAEIPNLTYEQFRDFHRRYYHPSNARIFLYGNIDSERYLTFIEDEFLSAFSTPASAASDAVAAASAGASASRAPGPAGGVTIPFQPRWSEPVRLTRTYPVDAEDEESRSSVTLNWLLPPVTDSFQTLAVEVLTEILLGHSGSPLYRVISESPLGEDLSAPTGIETELLEMGFSVGMRGTEAERVGEIEELILGELRRLTRDGIDSELVTAALRSVEFRNREIHGGPFGLRLMRKALRGWLHGEAPEQTLEFTRWFEDLRRAVDTQPRFFETLIEEHLLENPHRSTLIVIPDADEARHRREAEEAELARQGERMAEAERETVREAQERLLALQSEPDAPEDIAKVPFLTVDELPREVDVIPAEHTEADDGVPMLVHRLFTNGVAYLDFAFDLRAVPDHLYNYLMLYSAAATECGLTNMSYEDLSRELATHTGGLTLQLDVGTRVDEESDLRCYLFVRMKALPRSLPEAFKLLEGVLLRPNFADAERLGTVVRELRNDFRSSVLPTGHSYVGLRSARALSRTARIEERWKGLSQLLFLERLAEEDTGTVTAQLEELRAALVGAAAMTLSVTAEEGDIGQVAADTRGFVARIRRAGAELTEAAGEPAAASAPAAAADELPRWESILVSAGVNYVGASVEAAHLSEPGHVPESVLAHLLRTGFLWEEIRMKGGAYGAMAGTRALERVFSFASYRDPNIAATLERFGRGLRQTSEEGIDRASLELAIISGVGRDSRPLSPGQKSIVSLKRSLYGISDDLRQWKRDELLAVSEDAVRDAAGRLAERFEGVHVSVMGSRAAVEEAASEYPGILDHTLELHL
ncbi:MAG: peptidase M16 [Spirochaetes bacterium]|jgi:Zn-dependent M16 (insulinase) family peptidase|nr:peptidase M16 [Spirochaetota bacterium]